MHFSEDAFIEKLRSWYASQDSYFEFDITGWLGAALGRGELKRSFFLPNGLSWGKMVKMKLGKQGVNWIDRVKQVKCVMYKLPNGGYELTLVGYDDEKEIGRSVWVWDGKEFEYRETKTNNTSQRYEPKLKESRRLVKVRKHPRISIDLKFCNS